MKIIKVWLFFLALISISSHSAVSTGSIKTILGDVSLSRDNTIFSPEIGMEVFKSDELITGKASSVGVIMKDNTILTAGEDSVLNIESFSYDKRSRRGNLRANLKRGSLSSISGHLAKTSPDSVRFKTATMTLGVRGTEFLIDVTDGEKIDTSVILLPEIDGTAGVIDVESSLGEITTVDKPFENLVVAQDGSITSSILDSLSVFSKYCGLLGAQPARPKTYLFYFDDITNNLTEDSLEMLEALKSDIKIKTNPELEIAGYTDNDLSNNEADALSLILAKRLEDIINLSDDLFESDVVGRGSRDLLFKSDVQFKEKRNYRVEVVLK